jgi:hypothetical protein
LLRRNLGETRTRDKGAHRDIQEADGTFTLKQRQLPYTVNFGPENGLLSLKNTVCWGENISSIYT